MALGSPTHHAALGPKGRCAAGGGPCPPEPPDDLFGVPHATFGAAGPFATLAEFASESDPMEGPPSHHFALETPDLYFHREDQGGPIAEFRAGSAGPTSDRPEVFGPPVPPPPVRRDMDRGERFSRVQKILVAGIIAFGLTLVLVLVVKVPWSYAPDGEADRPYDPRPVTRDGFQAPSPPPAANRGAVASGVTSDVGRPTSRAPQPPDETSRATATDTQPVATGHETRTADLPVRSSILPPSRSTLPSPESLSLQLADRLYQRRDFEPALVMYDKLYRQLAPREENQPVRDFLLLRMALCCRGRGDTAQADTMLRTVSMSRLPILRALARYHQATTLLGRQRYLEAAAQAYGTIALIEVANYDTKWVSAVQQQCGLLTAEAVTRHLLVLCDADGAPNVGATHASPVPDPVVNLPPELWSRHPDIDPFLEMDEPRLRVFLACGAEALEAALLSPQIRPLGGEAAGRWSVTCNGAPIEELLARFAANAGVNLRWADAGATGSPSQTFGTGAPMHTSPVRAVEENVRARPVYVYLPSATAQQVVTTAAGSVGLIAQAVPGEGPQTRPVALGDPVPSPATRDPNHEWDPKRDASRLGTQSRVTGHATMRLLDPMAYSSLAEHTGLLAQEAITLWQRFLLSSQPDAQRPSGPDPRAAQAHFAIALLQAVRGQFDEAIAEYRLVAHQYPRHGLAPHALLRSGTLKVRLRDYLGAQTDLKQLIELYPETELADRACLYLADATMKAGLYEEATDLYRKVYNLGLSASAQTESALGVGRCLYETGRHEEAAKWLTRYVTLAHDRSRPEFSAACLLLGKACLALHQPQQAQGALHLALQGELSRQQHVQTIALLGQTYLEQGLFLEALATLEGTSGWQLSQQETVDLAVLRAQTLRAIGLVDKATALLEEKGQYLSSPELRAKVALELTGCLLADGRLEQARQTLGEAFATAEPGPLAARIGRELAGVCLRLGQTAQAVTVCTQLLERADAAERPAILTLLADTYRRQGKYDEALTAMLMNYDL